jgi:hypothetical protein
MTPAPEKEPIVPCREVCTWKNDRKCHCPFLPECASHSASSDVLDLIEAIIQDRIIELKLWMRLAKRNEDRKRVLEISPLIGENQAMLAQIKELRSQQTKEHKGKHFEMVQEP